MRVLQLVQQAQMRGAEIDALQLGDELERRGVEVRTAYLYETRSMPSALRRERDVRLRGDYGSVLERIPGWHPGLLRRLARAVDDFRPDIIQAGGGRTVKYGALVCRGRPRCRLVWRNIGEIDRWLKGTSRRAFYRLVVLPQVDAVVSMTRSGADAFRGLLGDRVITDAVPPGIDPSRLQASRSRGDVRREMGVDATSSVALVIGSLSSEKRIDVALEATRDARETVPGLALWVVGDGPMRDRLETLAGRLGIETATSFLGTRTDIGDLLGGSDLLLVSSDTEGLPRVILEAALTSRPVVSTAVGGIPDVILHGQTGLLSPPGDAAALAANMVTLIGNEELARSLAKAAFDWVDEHATVQAVADRYQALYERLVGARGRPSSSSPKPSASRTGSRKSSHATSP